MTTWELVAENVKHLPPDKQLEVLDFVEFIRLRQSSRKPLRSLAGLWQGFDISAEDIDGARREMWGNFPRDGI